MHRRHVLRVPRTATLSIALLAALMAGSFAYAQVAEGEVQVSIQDPNGRPVAAEVEITSRSPQFTTTAEASAEGEVTISRLPAAVYLMTVREDGFQEHTETVEIRSPVPHQINVTLQLGVIATQVDVQDTAPLLDTQRPNLVMQLQRRQLDEAMGTTLGRSAIDAVTTLPGWLLEANAVLHPRGSEYDTQYVVDGMPVYDNRSIAFAPPYENEEFEAVNVMTAGMPAEFGRRMGGVISLDTRRVATRGYDWDVNYQGGSFNNHLGSATYQKRMDRTAFLVGARGGRTDRYLDPPSLENFTNNGSTGGLNARLEQDITDRDRLTFYLRSNRTNFLVPNDLTQQLAGQRQDRRSAETAGQVHYQRTIGTNKVAMVQGMVRDLSSLLWSNPFATPVNANQDRGFLQGVISGSFTVEQERQTLKFGGDFRTANIRERFGIGEADEFPELDLEFDDQRRSKEASFFVQDSLRLGNFSANLGLRYDYYTLLIEDHAWSPRIGLGYYIPGIDLQLRASYDRIFQPPPMENLLLSSGATGLGLDEVEDGIPVPANRGNFFEVGLSKPLFNNLRLDVSHYWRTFRNYIDDDVFLNTGLGFPITFDTARITGTDVRVEVPEWHGISASASWSNMKGIAGGPVTGGLFIQGGEAEELRGVVQHFPISQDQRNTLATEVRFQPHERVWFTVGIRYGSGLPVELEDDDDDDDDHDGDDDDDDDDDIDLDDDDLDLDDDDDDDADHDDDGDDDDDDAGGAIPQAILDKINFQRGRVRPNFSLNMSAGLRLWEVGSRSATLQFDMRNITDRLNVINFSGLFSGTAIATGRQFTVGLRFRF